MTLLDPRARHQTREAVRPVPAPASLRVPPGGRGWTTGGVVLVIPREASPRSLRDAAAECVAEAERRERA